MRERPYLIPMPAGRIRWLPVVLGLSLVLSIASGQEQFTLSNRPAG
jgi:hypothetical protein